MSDFDLISQALIACDESKVMQLVQQALDQGGIAQDILDKGLIAAMDIVGEKMESEEMFIPEVLRAAKIMNAAIGILKPHLAEENIKARTKVVIGTVKGDLHDIGKNLVAMMMESSGLEVHNLGVDIAPEQFVAAVKERKAEILCLSALLTTTTPMMKLTVDAAVESGIRNQVKILVGGAPVTQKYADDIGADGYAPDAGSATKLVKKLIR
jgi:5-methyltetrahydrofolate--homocysteine methyltransferase